MQVTTCPDTTPMASVPESVLGSQTHDPTTSPLGLEVRIYILIYMHVI